MDVKNSSFPEHGFFVTGTDTDVGKTYITAGILRSLVQAGRSVGAFKPAVSGILPGVPCDPDILAQASGNHEKDSLYCNQRFIAPLAPPIAAELEGKSIDEEQMIQGVEQWKDRCEILFVEGAGGWHSPISNHWTNADLAQRLRYPIILVAANRLGVVNHVLLTLESIIRCNLRPHMVILNHARSSHDDLSASSNERLLNSFLKPRFGDIPCYRWEAGQTVYPGIEAIFE
jgi:dethiobiotin synthetase